MFGFRLSKHVADKNARNFTKVYIVRHCTLSTERKCALIACVVFVMIELVIELILPIDIWLAVSGDLKVTELCGSYS
jgi:hypothetical protein